MSACVECLRASLLRADVSAALEISGAGPEAAREVFDAGEDAMVAELVARGVRSPGSTPIPPNEVWRICRHDSEFPPGLTAFTRPADVPHVLYGVGDRNQLERLADRGGIAVVGARRATAYGREVAYSLSRDAAGLGLSVVSGMALGIDGAAHRGVLQGGGSTIAVLAGGPDVAYPRSHRLLHEQILGSGCVISENPPGFEARRWGFVARNRIIAGLVRMVVFVEGSENSGARHTVEFATELGAEVGVVPGPVTSPLSAGPNELLGDEGVWTIRGIDDVAEILMLERFAGVAEPPTGGDSLADRLLELIGAGARTPRELAESLSDQTPREISRSLGQLELNGRLRRGSGGEYERVV